MLELRRTVRRLWRARGFTLTTILTLALGIGATIAIFTVVNGILLRPLPFPEADRLVSLIHRVPPSGNRVSASTAIYFTYRDNNRAFDSVALYAPQSATVTGAGTPEQLESMNATFELLGTLGVAPALGRAFVAADDRPDSAPTVILSHGYWQRRFGGAENALGQDLIVDGVAHRIIGVLPRDFRFLSRPAEILLPMRPNPAVSFVGPFGERGLARLRDGVTLEEASADIARMIPILKEAFPPTPGFDAQAFRLEPDLEPLKETFVGDLDDVLLLLMGTIGMLLAIACANVANLHLVRTEVRAYELAIRSALGASRSRIAAALLRESLLLALIGGALGVGLAALALPVLLATAGDELPAVLAVAIDPTVLGFALALSLVSGVVFGAVPALRYAGRRVAMMRATGRAHSTSHERHRAHRGLIAAQVAFALILLIASGLMMRTFESLLDIDPGFVAPEDVQTVSVSLPRAAVPEFSRAVRLFEQMRDAVGSLAGVEHAGFASRLPLTDGPQTGFFVENARLAEGERPPLSDFRFVSPRFFETLGTPLLAGRTFEWADHHEARGVVIVSESFARREWRTPQDALGKRLRFSPSEAEPWREVVGVVGDVRNERLDSSATDAVYLTLYGDLAAFLARTATFVIRSERVGTAGFVEDLRRAVWSVDPAAPLWDIGRLSDLHARATARTTLTLVLLAIAGCMALALGLVGIYGVIGYMLAQRTREIGIRIALGAPTGALERMMLGRILLPVLAGVVLGLGGAAALSRLMDSLLFGVTALDPGTYALAALVLVATAVAAAYLPARRVAQIAPTVALRAD